MGLDLRLDFSRATTDSYREYMLKLISMIRRKEVECFVEKVVAEAKNVKPRVERRNVDSGDVFRVRAYILAPDIEATSVTGIRIPLRIVCNSAFLARESGEVELFLRLGSLACPPLGCWNCRTFIAYAKTELENLRGRVRVEAKSMIYPMVSMECIEDPRTDPDDSTTLYYVVGHYRYWDINGLRVYVLTFSAKVENGEVKYVEPIVFRAPNGELFLFRDYRDTFALSRKAIVTRPWLEHFGTGVMVVAPREGNVVDLKGLTTYPELIPTKDELKTGGNCSVKISSNEYLVLFHAVDRYFGAYYTYAAIFSEDGELLAVTPEPVISPRPREFTGTRPATIFVNGAQLVKDTLIVSAGKDDEMLLFLETELSKVIEKMKFLKG